MPAVHESPSNVLPPSVEGARRTMRAVVHRQYGEPEVLTLGEVERPVPGDDDVLVRVHAAGVNIGDHHLITGKPYLVRLSPFGGVPGPRHPVPGATMAGVVEALGAKVTGFRLGEEVYGQAAHGAFAEYVVVRAEHLAPKPRTLSFEEAAVVPWAATALQGLRDAGGVVAGQKVLIFGASGGVGTWAVQIAKALGAEVTALCSARNVERMRALGADEVIDYGKEDFVARGACFDVMLDLVGSRSLADCRSVLTPEGVYVACAGGGGDWVGPVFRIVGGLVSSWFTRRRFKTFVMAPNGKDLAFLTALVDAGKARPVIERSYPMSEVADALRHVGEGHAQGQTVLRIVG